MRIEYVKYSILKKGTSEQIKSTGIVRKLDTLYIHKKAPLEILVEGEMRILQKYEGYGAGPITGKISSQNIKLADGKLTISLEGAKKLLNELEQYLERA